MEVLGVINPLLEEAELIGGQLWVPGNRVLINLNLARESNYYVIYLHTIDSHPQRSFQELYVKPC